VGESASVCVCTCERECVRESVGESERECVGIRESVSESAPMHI